MVAIRIRGLCGSLRRRVEHSTGRTTVTEHEVMQATPDGPATVASLTRDLRALGLRTGDVVITHTSLSALGWVVGGAVAVVTALEGVLGDEGTLVMPTQTGGLIDPENWGNPPAPKQWWPVIRAHLPPYDPATTPSVGVGIVPEVFRAQPDVLRSGHSLYSFAARGPLAGQVTTDHLLSYGLGESSPLGRLYDLDARVLLLGVDHSANTSLHLCEYRASTDWQRQCQVRLPIGSDETGVTRWITVDDIELDEGDFAGLGAAYERNSGSIRTGPVGAGTGRLMSQRELVDFGVAWIHTHRRPTT